MRADYVIVGGGTAGVVLAARLSERSGVSVVLLEAGGPDRGPLFRVPAGFVATVNHPRYGWGYRTEPLATLGGRTLPCPRGRVLGGSSSVNGMIFVPGQAEDYDAWRARGHVGWGSADVFAALGRAVHVLGVDGRGEGSGGPIAVGPCPHRDPLSDAFLAAACAHGLPRNDGFDGASQEGAGYYFFNIAGGERRSAARAYLRAARRRPNLRIVPFARATSVLFEGARAVGVTYARGGATHVARADREVILAGGAIGSPELLLRSGVGPSDELAAIGITPRVHAPGVGKNLQDHFMVRASYEVHGVPSMNRLRRPLAQLGAVAAWALRRRGPLANGPATVGAFFRTRPDVDRPDAQLHFVPCSFDVVPGGQELHAHDGMTAGIYALRPTSRGEVRLASPRLDDPPRIAPAHLATEDDRRVTVDALRIQRAIFESDALAHVRGRAIAPGPDVQDDDAWLAYARAAGDSAHHPCGTCAMGDVVDDALRVRGAGALRVVDASIMPTIVSANTHAATLAIAEIGAAAILREVAS